MSQLLNCICGGKAEMVEHDTPADGHWMGSDGYTEYKIRCTLCHIQTGSYIGKEGRKRAEETWANFMMRAVQPKTIEKQASPVNITIEKGGSSTEKPHPVDVVLGRVPRQKPEESHTLLIPRKEAIEIIKDDHEDWMQVETKIESQSRWQTFYIGIYKHKPTNKFYTVDFTRGSTKKQDSEYFYIDPVNFEEVEMRERIVEQYVKIGAQ
jgi:hypothetical protein